jgi:PAS domain S-box-containing protein
VAILAASLFGRFSGEALILGVVLAAWTGGWVGGLIAASVCPIALSFWPRITPGEWVTCAVVVVVVSVARERIAKMRRSEKKLRALLSSMNDVILVLDKVGTYIEVVPTKPSLLFRPAEVMQGRRINDFFPPEQTRFFLRHIRAACEEQRTVNVDYSLNIEGRAVWFSAAVSPLSGDLVLWVARDITPRKLAEEATELRYRSMVDQASDIIFTLNRERKITSLNPAFTRVTGHRAAEWIGRDFVDLIEVDARPQAAEAFARTLAKGSIHGALASVTCVDGSAVVLESSLINQTFSGESAGFLGFARDVTEARAAEEELRRTEQRLAEAQRLAKIGTWEVDLDSNRLWWSDESYRIFGLEPSAAQLTFDDFIRFVVPEDRPLVDDVTKILFERGEHEWELRIRSGDGADKIISCHGHLIQSGGRRLIGTSQDITEKKRSERLLHESNERFRLIARATSDAVWDLDYETGHVWRGEGYETLFGYPAGSLAPNVEAFRELVHPEDREQLRMSFGEAIHSGQLSFTHEFRFRRADGSYANILDRGYVVRDAQMRPIRILGAMMDVTERKQMTEQLEQAKRLSSLGRLAGSIAHEFNNVLMGVQANAEIIGRRAPGELQHTVGNITGAVRRGRRITEEILRYMRPSDPAPQSLNVRRFLEQWADEIRPSLGARLQVEIGIEGGDDLYIRADPQQVAQVFTNMAFNSRDAVSDAGGVMSVHADAANSYTTFAFGVVRTPDRFMHFRVRDNGSGIPPEQLKHVFEPLYTTKRDGTGLGLAVSYQIVTRSDGHIFVESEQGKGTTFHVFLPLCCEELAAPPALPAAPPTTSSALGRVLLVEDDPEVAAGVSMLLECEGAEVEVVHTGGETLPAIERFHPDVVILDIGLPDMDGVEVYEQIAVRWPDLRVLFSSGHAQARNLERWLARPNVALLVKPYETSDLVAALSRLVVAVAA